MVGRAPMAHAAHCRMEHAATLLAQTRQPVAAIAAQVGILDPSYFARLFRAHIGVQPVAYRRRFQS
ncbi:MAG: helix-turn-helix domain-containing protein [Planctomycetes bacterium]|nr:helix-turn-helix domain-containing protein [Planctomycetota bacterium]